jgi:hypothetical protein
MSTKINPKKRYIARYWKSLIDGRWYFNLTSANGKIVAQSEGYERCRSALKIIKTMMPIVRRVEKLKK